MLYTLSGAPWEAFSKFPVPRATRVFEPTFQGKGILRSDDITEAPRYGHNPPYHGMPKGHPPARSDLAVPMISRSGDFLFVGNDNAGCNLAGLYSLVATCEANSVNPRVYLANVLLRVQSPWSAGWKSCCPAPGRAASSWMPREPRGWVRGTDRMEPVSQKRVPPQPTLGHSAKPSPEVCPRAFCFHYVPAGSSFAPGVSPSVEAAMRGARPTADSFCGCSFGRCTRLGAPGADADGYEPNEPALERAGLPWFFFIPSADSLPAEWQEEYLRESAWFWGAAPTGK